MLVRSIRLGVFSILCGVAVAACGGSGQKAPPITVTFDGGTFPDMIPAVEVDLATVPPSADGGGGIGSDCTSLSAEFAQGNCQAGFICLSEAEGYPGGLCVAECDDSTPCPSGSTCVQGELASSCQQSCTMDKDCRKGWTCSTRTHACRPPQTGGAPALPAGLMASGDACATVPAIPPRGFFVKPTLLSSQNHRATDAQIAVDRVNGRVLVAWSDLSQQAEQVSLAISTDDGATFAPSTKLPIDTGPYSTDYISVPSAVADKLGNLAVAWLGYDADASGQTILKMNVFVAVSASGSTFGTLAKITPPNEFTIDGTLGSPSLSASPLDGTLAVTWTQLDPDTNQRNIRLATSTDHGVTWSAPQTVSDTSDRSMNVRGRGRSAFGSDGKLYITWVEYVTQQFGSAANSVYLQRMAVDGTKDGANVKVSGMEDSPGYEVPAIAVIGSTVVVGFNSGTPQGAWDIKAAVSEDSGATFDDSFNINDDLPCATHFRLAFTVDDNQLLHVVWYDNRYLQANVFHSVVAFGSGTHSITSNQLVNPAGFTFTTALQGFSTLSDYLGVTTSGTSLFVGWSQNASMGFGSGLYITHAPLVTP